MKRQPIVQDRGKSRKMECPICRGYTTKVIWRSADPRGPTERRFACHDPLCEWKGCKAPKLDRIVYTSLNIEDQLALKDLCQSVRFVIQFGVGGAEEELRCEITRLQRVVNRLNP